MSRRLIPLLLVKDQRLVKSVGFEDFTYVGDPLNAIRIFNEKEVDEITVLDVGCSRFDRPINFDFVEELTGECRMPISYGGGVRTIFEARRLFGCGLDKVCLGGHPVHDLELIGEISSEFGSQAVVACLNVATQLGDDMTLWVDSRNRSAVSFSKYASDLIAAGVGELLVQSVRLDGSLRGPDFELARTTSAIPIPVIYGGGVAVTDDVEALFEVGVDGVASGSMLTFYGPYRAVLLWYPKIGDRRYPGKADQNEVQ